MFHLLLRSSFCNISRKIVPKKCAVCFAPFSCLFFRNKLQKVCLALKTVLILKFLPILSYFSQILFTWVTNIEPRRFSSFFGRIIPRNAWWYNVTQWYNVSDSFSVHHQEIFTVHTMVYVLQFGWQLLSRSKCSCSIAVSKPVWHTPFCVYSESSWWWTKELPETCRVSFQK